MVTRVVPVRNVSVRELAPRCASSTTTLAVATWCITSRPTCCSSPAGRPWSTRLVEVVRRVDKAGDQDMDVIKLKYASAGEMVRLVTNLNKDGNNQGANASLLLSPKVVADERTNSVVISGEPKARARIIQMVRQLDRDLQSQGNTRVFSPEIWQGQGFWWMCSRASAPASRRTRRGGGGHRWWCQHRRRSARHLRRRDHQCPGDHRSA